MSARRWVPLARLAEEVRLADERGGAQFCTDTIRKRVFGEGCLTLTQSLTLTQILTLTLTLTLSPTLALTLTLTPALRVRSAAAAVERRAADRARPRRGEP